MILHVISDYPAKFRDHRLFWKRKLFNLSRDLIWARGQRLMWYHGLVLLIISHHPIKFGGNRLCEIRDIKLLNCHVISSGYVTLWVSCPNHKSKFCGYRPCRIGDILFLIGHVTSCNHVVNGLYGILWHYVSLLLSQHRADPMSVFVENT